MTGVNMIKTLNYTCQGESHKATDKVCQDYSLTQTTKEGISIAIVCDGHGGERYFRSNFGAKFAADVTLEKVLSLVYNTGDSLFEGKPFTAVGPTRTLKDAENINNVDKSLRRLFSSIIYSWNEKIKEHASANKLTEWEKKHVPEEYLREFVLGNKLEKQYGATLMVYVQTPRYWFAFHIGDGKCLFFQKNPIWSEPIPWDDNCFLNKTTSLCDSNAIEDFRYCYQGDGSFPTAVFLGSDGLDDTFGESDNLANFYIQVIKMLADHGVERTENELRISLPELSKRGSKDDMSVACVFNDDEIKDNKDLFIRYQIERIGKKMDEVESRIDKLKIRRDSLVEYHDEKTKIDYEYALKDLKAAKGLRKELADKYNKITEELPKGSIPKYQIEDEEEVIKGKEEIKNVKDTRRKKKQIKTIKIVYYYTKNPIKKRMSFKEFKLQKSSK